MNMINAIADQKKAEIDALTAKVTQTQYEVQELQAVVDALTSKASEFEGFLSAADNNKSQALSQLNLAKEAVAKITELTRNTSNADQQTRIANHNVSETADMVAQLINKLIFSVEVIDKLSDYVSRQRSLNNIIPETLVTTLATATTQANTAVSATLNALQSCYSASASVNEASEITCLERRQSETLLALITGNNDEQQVTHVLTHQAFAQITTVESEIQHLNAAESHLHSKLEAVSKYQTLLHNNEQTLLTTTDEATRLQIQKALISDRNNLSAAQHAYDEAQESLSEVSLRLDAHMLSLGQITLQQQDLALFNLLSKNYERAAYEYQSALKANAVVTQQLEHAQADLLNAQTTLASLTAGLNAAKAAAFAA